MVTLSLSLRKRHFVELAALSKTGANFKGIDPITEMTYPRLVPV